MGGEHAGVMAQDFVLAENEFITSVTGRSGDLIDVLCLTTNLGR